MEQSLTETLYETVTELTAMLRVEQERWIESSAKCKTYEHIDNHLVALAVARHFLEEQNFKAALLMLMQCNITEASIRTCFRAVSAEVRDRQSKLAATLCTCIAIVTAASTMPALE